MSLLSHKYKPLVYVYTVLSTFSSMKLIGLGATASAERQETQPRAPLTRCPQRGDHGGRGGQQQRARTSGQEEQQQLDSSGSEGGEKVRI